MRNDDSRSRKEDIISSLPKEILCNILSLMPMKSAGRTSVLSSTWRYLWKHKRVFSFDKLPYSFDQPVDYSSNIDQCLEICRRDSSVRVDVFMVYGLIGLESFPRVDQWVDFAVARGVQELELSILTRFRRFFDLPPSFYLSQTILIMHLCHVKFVPPSSFSGFSQLKDLSFYNSILYDEVVQTIGASCNLEILKLNRCYGLAKVRISNPKLKRFSFVNYGGLGLELEVDAPNLEYFRYSGDIATTRLNSFNNCADLSHLTGFARKLALKETRILLRELALIKALKVDPWFFHFSENLCMVGDRNPCKLFENLESFFWCGHLKQQELVMSLLAFVRDCPSLKKIELYLKGRKEQCVEWKEEEHKELYAGVFDQLRTINISYYAGHTCEVELLKLLLQKAVALDTFTVMFRDPTTGGEPNETVTEFLKAQISRLHRASPHSRVLFGKYKKRALDKSHLGSISNSSRYSLSNPAADFLDWRFLQYA